MKPIPTIQEYLDGVRASYLDESEPSVKQAWLKLGLTIKAMIDNGEYFEFDLADDAFQSKAFERFDSS